MGTAASLNVEEVAYPYMLGYIFGMDSLDYNCSNFTVAPRDASI